MVLPMPVGAMAKSRPLETMVSLTASDSSCWPGRYSGKGKSRVEIDASRRAHHSCQMRAQRR